MRFYNILSIFASILLFRMNQANEVTVHCNVTTIGVCEIGYVKQDINILEGDTLEFIVQNKESIKSVKIGSYIHVNHIPNGIFSTFPDLETLQIYCNGVRVLDRNHFEGATKLRTLNLHSIGIKEIPDNVFNGLISLKELSLSGTHIQKLNRLAFAGAPNIERLILGNGINIIEEGSLNLPNLIDLQLLRSSLKTLDGSLLASNIRYLNASYSRIETIKEGSLNFPNLEELNLRENRIEILYSLCGIPNVRKINLYGNQIHTIGNSFNCSKNLEELILAFNKIKNVEGEFVLPKLLELNLCGNDIKILNENFFTGMPNIKKVLLCHNQIHNIGKAFNGIRTIEELDLSNNLIENITEDQFNLPSLFKLTLYANKIETLNLAGAGNLRSLGLVYTGIKTIQSLNLTHNLEILDLQSNGIEIINREFFSTVPNIRKISLKYNNIKSIENGSLNLQNLRQINLGNNNLTTLYDSIFSEAPNLNVIALNANNLSHIGNVFSDSHQLVELNLNNNHIKDINLTAFAQLQSLEALGLYDNGYKYVDETPSSPVITSKLKKIILRGMGLSNPDIFKHLTIFPQLEAINMLSNKFTVVNDLDKITDFFPKLTKICIDDDVLNIQSWRDKNKQFEKYCDIRIDDVYSVFLHR